MALTDVEDATVEGRADVTFDGEENATTGSVFYKVDRTTHIRGQNVQLLIGTKSGILPDVRYAHGTTKEN